MKYSLEGAVGDVPATVQHRNNLSHAALTLTAFALVQKLLSLVQQIMLVRVIGINATTDAFYMAQTVPLIVGAMLSLALTVTLVAALRRTERSELCAVLATFTVLLLILTASAFLGSATIIRLLGPNLKPATAQMAGRLLAEMSPLIFFMGATGILTAYHYHTSSFLIPAAAGCLLYIGAIAGVLLEPRFGIDTLSWGVLLGGVMQSLTLLVHFDKTWFLRPAFKWNPHWRFACGLSGVLGITAVTPLYAIIDRGFASGSDGGTLAALTIAVNLMTIPSALIVMSLNSAILPGFVLVRKNMNEFGRLLQQGILYMAFFLVAATVVMTYWAEPIVRLLFASSHFDHAAEMLTSKLVAAYGISIVGIGLKDIISNALIALGREWTAMAVGLGTLALSVLFKSFGPAHPDPIWIALSTASAVWLGAIVFTAISSRLVHISLIEIVWHDGYKILVAGIVLGVFCRLLDASVISGTRAVTCAAIGAGGLIYILVARALHLDIMDLRSPQPLTSR